jgi:protein-disulfide isomerase
VSKKTLKSGKELKKSNNLKIGFIAIIIVAVIGILFFVFSQPVDSKTLEDDDPFFGPENASVVIVEFSDFQCPVCGKEYSVLKQLKEEFGDRVKFVYRDFPLTNIHSFALISAIAAQCANEQGKFWEYHDKLFENQDALDAASLKKYALELGLNSEQFNKCLDEVKFLSEVQKDFSDGLKLGVKGTPTFFVNGQKLDGFQSYEKLRELILSKLS